METELDQAWRFKRAFERLERRRRAAQTRAQLLQATLARGAPSPRLTAELEATRRQLQALERRDRELWLRSVTEELGEGD